MSQILVDQYNKMCENSLISHLQITFTEIGEDYVVAEMPVQPIVYQPFGLLHGGASVVLAESLGSLLSNKLIDNEKFMAVGQNIEAHHLRSKKSGKVKGKAIIIKAGRTSHLVKIEITDEEEKLISYSHLTNAIIPKNL
ncbi:PaaI family thioesterase [Weeksella virosa]|uniref:PaaI family thioesterase n=1 Tax=Weeksella virosa TaxID=1014 RepID=UPI002556254C|nr:PaaI family thioesterase [Weeksella virosa]MDK7675032.1 PaaI family thioesterase [Weeksella virosa]